MGDLTELLEGWDDPLSTDLGYRNVSEAEEIISMLRIVKDKWKDDAIMLQAQVKKLEAKLIAVYELLESEKSGF